MIQQFLNNGGTQKPEVKQPEAQKLEAKQPDVQLEKSGGVDVQQVLQGFVDYVAVRQRSDAEALATTHLQLKTANSQLIEEVCISIEEQIRHWQSLVNILRTSIKK